MPASINMTTDWVLGLSYPDWVVGCDVVGVDGSGDRGGLRARRMGKF